MRHDIQQNETQHKDIRHNDIQYKGLICDNQHNGTPYRVLLGWHYAQDLFIIIPNVILLSNVMLSVVMLSVITLRVVMLNVVAPFLVF